VSRYNIKADRAKQFIPFDALKGLKEALKEKEKIKVDKKELNEDEIQEISLVLKEVKKRDFVKVIYFSNNEYLVLEGMVSLIDYVYKKIKIIKTEIDFEDILSISIDKKFDY
jgi:hypothetical protein